MLLAPMPNVRLEGAPPHLYFTESRYRRAVKIGFVSTLFTILILGMGLLVTQANVEAVGWKAGTRSVSSSLNLH